MIFFFLMIRRPPRSTPLSLHDALPISRYHHQVRSAGRVVHEQDLLPCLPAVRGAVHSTLGIGSPRVAQSGHEDVVGIGGFVHHFMNLAAVVPSLVLPPLAGVLRRDATSATVHIV